MVETDEADVVDEATEPALDGTVDDQESDDDIGLGAPSISAALEALLLLADEPMTVMDLASAVREPADVVEETLRGLSDEYTADQRGFDLREVAGGWRYYTRAECSPLVERFVLDGQQARLTQASLETLAVIAYRQPITRGPDQRRPRRQRRRRHPHAAHARAHRRGRPRRRVRRAPVRHDRRTSSSAWASPPSTTFLRWPSTCPTWPTSRTCSTP